MLHVREALKGSPYEKVADKMAEEFDKANITKKDQVHNAPLKIRITYGADIYEVMRLILAYKGSQPIAKRIKKSS